MGRKGKKHKANRTKERQGTCVYCGASGQVEDEDVIPVCLFLKPAPDRVLVPSCRSCNVEKSKDDSYLRDMTAPDYRCYGNPVAEAVFNGPVLRSVRTNRSLVGRAFRSVGRMFPMQTHGGIYLGHMPGVSLEEKRIRRIFSTIVRGLNFRVRKQRLPDDTMFTVKRLSSPEDCEQLRQVIWEITGRIGQSVFECGCVFGEDPAESIWLLIFYSSVYVIVSTQPPDLGAIPAPLS